MKDLLAEVLDKLAQVEASQDELRQDRGEWRRRAERLLTDQRRPWWRRVVDRVSLCLTGAPRLPATTPRPAQGHCDGWGRGPVNPSLTIPEFILPPLQHFPPTSSGGPFGRPCFARVAGAGSCWRWSIPAHAERSRREGGRPRPPSGGSRRRPCLTLSLGSIACRRQPSAVVVGVARRRHCRHRCGRGQIGVVGSSLDLRENLSSHLCQLQIGLGHA
jgi:hypothetical protein